MTNDLSIRCRFCPVETRGPASGPLLARYRRHLRNCGAANRVAVERGLPLSEVIGDTLTRSGVADGPSVAAADVWPQVTARVDDALNWFGPPPTFDESVRSMAKEICRPHPLLDALERNRRSA